MKQNRIISMFALLWILGVALPLLGNTPPTINTKDISKGIVHISYISPNQARVKIMIEKGKDKYTYNLDSKGKVETFPLQLGNGNYKISILENTVGSKYKLIDTTTLELELSDPNKVYLNSIQNINWNTEMKAIKKSDGLNKGLTAATQKINKVYEYVVKEYSYDYKKLATLPTTYLPFIDKTYEEKTGICYDFSTLYASMLRSQGVPVKLVKGYSSNAEGYHAWNEAYNEKTKEWMIIDATYDLQVIKKNKSVKMIKLTKDYKKVNEY